MGAGPSADGGGSPNQQAKNKAARDAKKTASVEMGLGKDRMSNYSTAEGGTREGSGDGGNDGNGGNNNTITQVTQTAPTEAEVSQATTTEAEPDTEANRLLKIKKKGRSASIISGSRGVTKTSTDYSLGKKSLLGRV